MTSLWRLAALALLWLVAAAPETRLVTLAARGSVPAHVVRVRFWAADAAGPVPLLIYQPGWNGSADENAILLASLAKAGFNVAALDLATPQPPGFAEIATRLRLPMDLSSFQAMAQTVAEADWRVTLLAEDAAAMPDKLPGAETAPAVGILGYSFGGAVAAEACRQDARFAACLNLDGWLFGAAAEHPSPQPYCLISGDPYQATAPRADGPAARLDAVDGARLRTRMARMGGLYAQVIGLSHEGFTDRRGGSAAVRQLVAAFFGAYLAGRPAGMLDLDRPFPGVTLTRFPAPAT